MENNTASAEYRRWLISRYGIAKSDILGSYICGRRDFVTLDEAVSYAHELECQSPKGPELSPNHDVTSGVDHVPDASFDDAPRERVSHEASFTPKLAKRPKRPAGWKIALLTAICLVVGASIVYFNTRPPTISNSIVDRDAVSAFALPSTSGTGSASRAPEKLPASLAEPGVAVEPVGDVALERQVTASPSWLAGWWSEGGFCEGDAGQTFASNGQWGEWGTEGVWSLDGDILTVTHERHVKDTASGEPEDITPPHRTSGLVTNVTKNSFVFRTPAGPVTMGRCE